ncbi:hypothetical protein CRG98_048220 [Punica granatum]|uniref:Uncharacterized protein n=1 Tax=Punica granatum TaxID=22663 RepID=A0A2I0HI72_PUNGR|nr:hypothetical protein CRG98_048220 [Punica granatum]
MEEESITLTTFNTPQGRWIPKPTREKACWECKKVRLSHLECPKKRKESRTLRALGHERETCANIIRKNDDRTSSHQVNPLKEEIEEEIPEKEFSLLDELVAHPMMPKVEENRALLGELYGKFDYKVKYYAPPSFYMNEPIVST